jgi:hypothetical protein
LAEPHGREWFYKTQTDLEEETGLTRYEQEGARKKLVSCGVLEEAKRGIPAKLYFRVNQERLEELLLAKTSMQVWGKPTNKDAEFPQTVMRKTSMQVWGKPTSSHVEIPHPFIQ